MTRSLIPTPALAARIAAVEVGAKVCVVEVVKPQPLIPTREHYQYMHDARLANVIAACPHKPGDVVAVKEAFEPLEFNDHEVGLVYCATPTEGARGRNLVRWIHLGEEETLRWQHKSGRKFSARSMPLKFVRSFLRIESVACKRVQEITGAEVFATGIDNGSSNPTMGVRYENMQRMAYAEAHPKLWHDNPWCFFLAAVKVTA